MVHVLRSELAYNTLPFVAFPWILSYSKDLIVTCPKGPAKSISGIERHYLKALRYYFLTSTESDYATDHNAHFLRTKQPLVLNHDASVENHFDSRGGDSFLGRSILYSELEPEHFGLLC